MFWKDLGFWGLVTAGPLVWFAFGVAGDSFSTRWPGKNVLLLSIIVYPILEEFVFRGLIQGYLYEKPLFKRSMAGISLACVVTSILFAAAHLINQSVLWASLIFIPSIAFGWVRDRYQHILPAILLHSFYNAGFMLFVAHS